MKPRPDMLYFLGALLPLAIWLACLSLVYGLATIACARSLPAAPLRYVSIAIVLASIVSLVGVIAASWRRGNGGFLGYLARAMSLIAILATAWLLGPLLVLRAC